MKKEKLRLIALVFLIAGILALSGCTSQPNSPPGTSIAKGVEPTKIQSFSKADNAVCEENGKPVVRLFSTTWCPHCKWVKNAFDSTVNDYVAEGKIVAYHWEMDTGDNTLTSAIETAVPQSESEIFRQFNKKQSIPTFVFGCKYYRIGNAYEQQNNLKAEIGEFKAVIEELLKKQ